jgi:nitrilase
MPVNQSVRFKEIIKENSEMTKIAIIQESPVLLDRKKTIEKAIQFIEQAASADAKLVVFPEAYISGYPAWIWRLRPGGDWGTSEELHARLLDSAVDIDAGDLKLLCDSAKKNKITIVCGLNERDSKLSKATLYNTVVIIGKEGNILNRHRKLMPTNPERMVWGFGDGSGLNVVDTPAGRVGTLLCWENYMPLARYTLYSQGIEIYVAPTYDSGDEWLGTMQHIAREGRCWVICSGVALTNSDIPTDFPDRETLYPATEEWINPGDSAVIAPGGEIVAGPMRKEKGILFAEVDSKRVGISKRDLDITGHYSRPDIFTLTVNTQPQSPIKFK